jgi:uncharacterized membrane protein YheB (UPF0754 family)
MKFLIGACIGAVIGYVTNWLAIKMLFRPYEEKKVFGIKVPFTPGLIPKEKPRIAKSVGNAIGTHLLTKETIITSLCSENMNRQIKTWVKRKVEELYSSKITIAQKMKQLSDNKADNLKENIQAKVGNLIINSIREDRFKDKISCFIKDKIGGFLSNNPDVILQNESFLLIKKKLVNEIGEYLDSEELRIKTSQIISKKINGLDGNEVTLEEIIPESVVSTLKIQIYNKKYEIACEIKNILKQDKTQEKIKDAIANVISSKLNPMIAMFVNANTISEKVIPAVDEMLETEDTQNEIAQAIINSIDKLLKKKVSDILSNVTEEAKDDNIRNIINVVFDKFVNEQIAINACEKIESKIRQNESIEVLTNKMDVDLNKVISEFIIKYIYEYIDNSSFEIRINELVSKSIDKIINMPIDDLIDEDKEKISIIASNFAEELYNKFIQNKASEVIEILNIAQIVEDKINEFDVTFAEELIMEIASKELRAITLLGALLGCIMGLLSPLLNSIY